MNCGHYTPNSPTCQAAPNNGIFNLYSHLPGYRLPHMSGRYYACGVTNGIITAISYGTNPLFAMPMIMAGIGVSSILFYRYFFAALIYGALLVLVKKRTLRISLKELAALLYLSLLFSFSSITLFSSFRYIDVGISCTVLFVYPSLVAVISAIFYGERLTGIVVGAIALATVGVVFLSRGSPDAPLNPTGLLLVLTSALLYALYIVGVRQMKSIRRLRGEKLNFYVMLIGLVVYACNLRFGADLQALSSPMLWGCAILLAVIPTIVSLETLTVAIKLIGATRTSILGALEPLTAIIVGVSLFGEALTWRILVGFLLIISGVLLIVSQRKKSAPTSS